MVLLIHLWVFMQKKCSIAKKYIIWFFLLSEEQVLFLIILILFLRFNISPELNIWLASDKIVCYGPLEKKQTEHSICLGLITDVRQSLKTTFSKGKLVNFLAWGGGDYIPPG